MIEEIVEAWKTHNRINLRLIASVPDTRRRWRETPRGALRRA